MNKEVLKIKYWEKQLYKVWIIDESDDDDAQDIPIFDGTILECESYIRLRKKGYIA